MPSDQGATKLIRIFCLVVRNQLSLAAKEALAHVGEVARDLRHPPILTLSAGFKSLEARKAYWSAREGTLFPKCFHFDPASQRSGKWRP